MASFRQYPDIRTSHEDGIWSVEWTSKNQIITGSVDETVKVWNPKVVPPTDEQERRVELQQAKSFEGHTLGVISAIPNSAGDILYCSSLDSTIRVWDLATNTGSSIKAGPVEAWSLALDRSDRLLASGTYLLNNQANRKEDQIRFSHDSYCFLFGYDIGTQRGAINIWDVATKTKRCSLARAGKGEFVLSVAFSNLPAAGGEGRASASNDGSIGYSQYVVGGGYDGSVHYYDVEVEQMAARFDELHGHTQPVREVAFAKDDSLIFSASDDMTIHIYDAKRRGMVASLAGHTSWVLGIAVSPDGRHIATSSSDRTVKIWDLGMKCCIQTFEAANEQVGKTPEHYYFCQY